MLFPEDAGNGDANLPVQEPPKESMYVVGLINCQELLICWAKCKEGTSQPVLLSS